ncbi:hypothetical protein MAPG_06004 [Magnaporthiopsis poae ATCC 64411]|uniref:Nephrocystin 3-like N-terminal domain-containing protein n=1 Tax=Magnaporthiopsis poae (strain ATCC 64411 / 73-15) TaxID=644358 RepID=A0A0C4E0W6_MAGP6|nr:hypothetical protein MAPG_06004 [Magnaporthiopsis poae ATCC 64411]
MGGLVVKKALIIAHERRHIYGAIADATVGVIFLATPHRGSGIAAPAELAAKILRAAQFGTGTNAKLVSNLRQNAEILWDISCQFVDRASTLHIRTFYETEPLGFMSSLIVEKHSAVLHHPNEVAVPMLSKNHRTICQFSHAGCQNYALVRSALQDLRSRAASKRTAPKIGDESTIKLFHKSTYEEYKARVKPPIEDTCAWFLQESQYVAWLESPSSSLLRITADPGCGKTTLAAFLVDSIPQNLSTRGIEFTTVTYFFFDGNIAAQGDGAALLLALIHQLLKAEPALAPLAAERLAPNDAQLGWSLHDLCEIFRAIVLSGGPERKHGGGRIVCVVDALDECEAASMAKAIRFLVAIIFDDNNNSTDQGGWLKLVVTTRPSQPIDDLFRTLPSRRHHHQIQLADHAVQTTRDIATFIRARCAHLQTLTLCSDAVRRAVERRLAERSDHTFLWIHLALDLLEGNTDATPESFESALGSVPDRLEMLYDRILQRSAAQHPNTLLRVLSVIVASRRALTLDEIDVALAVRPDDTSVAQVRRRCQFDIARRLYAVCGPFIRIANGVVSFIHQTAAEFLVRSPDIPRSLVDTDNSGGRRTYRYKGCLDSVGVNRCLAEICVAYLMLAAADAASDGPPSPGLQAAGDVMDMDGDEGTEDEKKFEQSSGRGAGGLFDYAAKHWGTHCRLANVSASSSSTLASPSAVFSGHEHDALFAKAITLCDTSTSTFRAWFQLYWDSISATPRFPDGLTPLMLASHIGLLGVMRALLHLSDGEAPNQYRLPLTSAAARATWPRTVSRRHLRDADSEGWTALHWAVWNGHGTGQGSLVDDAVIALLLQQQRHDDSDDDDGNEDGDRSRDNKGHYCHNDNKPDQGQSNYSLAKRTKPTRIRVPVLDLQDRRGLTALHWAAADDQQGAMRLLLEAGAAVDVFDVEGMTPLSLAVENEFLGGIDLLLEYGADVNAATSTDASEGRSQDMDIGEHGEEEEEEAGE